MFSLCDRKCICVCSKNERVLLSHSIYLSLSLSFSLSLSSTERMINLIHFLPLILFRLSCWCCDFCLFPLYSVFALQAVKQRQMSLLSSSLFSLELPYPVLSSCYTRVVVAVLWFPLFPDFYLSSWVILCIFTPLSFFVVDSFTSVTWFPCVYVFHSCSFLSVFFLQDIFLLLLLLLRNKRKERHSLLHLQVPLFL